MNPDLIFILIILFLVVGAFLLYSYLTVKQNNPTREHIKNVAGSWVWMLSLLFGAYWLGETATAVLIISIGIKALHEISRLHIHHQTHKKTVLLDDESAKETFINTKFNPALTLSLIGVLLLMTVSWLKLNHLLTVHNQRSLMLFMLFVIQFNDVNQYIAGRLFGDKIFTRKLAPMLSPNKTIEGAIFGTLMTGVLSLPIGYLLTDYTPLTCIGVAVLMGLCGIAGDLLQSAVKRQYGVKDMGTWIKGHGGIMDRVDSLLIALPVFFWVFVWS